MNKTRRDGDTQFTEYVHKQRARNVFMRCQRRQRGVGWGVGEEKRVTATCVLQKSDTDTANSFGVVTQAGGQGNETPLVAQRGGINA